RPPLGTSRFAQTGNPTSAQGLILLWGEPPEGMPSANSAIGGRPKKHGRQARFHNTTPPPPTKTVGGGGRISREICRFFPLRPLIGGRGSNLREKCRSLGASPVIRWRGRLAGLRPDGGDFEPGLFCHFATLFEM